jgi:hypothetical protein
MTSDIQLRRVNPWAARPGLKHRRAGIALREVARRTLIEHYVSVWQHIPLRTWPKGGAAPGRTEQTRPRSGAERLGTHDGADPRSRGVVARMQVPDASVDSNRKADGRSP